MLAHMMRMPLTISSLIRHADRWHGDTEIVSRLPEGHLQRSTWTGVHRRSRRLANALRGLNLGYGQCVGTLAWNTQRHLEIYYAVSGAGAVCHTVNPRLFPEQIAWIINDAGDRYVFFDTTFHGIVEAIAPRCPGVKGWVAMTDAQNMPKSGLPLLCYEDLIAAHGDEFAWPQIAEDTASSLCYTSGTTGNPKGALYSHRSTVLHSFAACAPDVFGLSATDVVLPVVPMFHVNAWGLPYAAAMAGSKLVLPGPRLDGASLYELIEAEGVTFAAGVPTIWLALLQHMEKFGRE